jgi:hypothetical protein
MRVTSMQKRVLLNMTKWDTGTKFTICHSYSTVADLVFVVSSRQTANFKITGRPWST